MIVLLKKVYFYWFIKKFLGRQEAEVRSKTKGDEGLRKCLKEMEKYEKCMKKQNIGKNMRLIRAPEAYLEILGVEKD